MLKWLKRRLLLSARCSNSLQQLLEQASGCLPADALGLFVYLIEEMHSADFLLARARDELCFQAYGSLKTGVFWLERPRVSRALHWHREEGKGAPVRGAFGAGPQRILLLCSSACYLYKISACLMTTLLFLSCPLLKRYVVLRICDAGCKIQSFLDFSECRWPHLLS